MDLRVSQPMCKHEDGIRKERNNPLIFWYSSNDTQIDRGFKLDVF